MGRKPVGEPTYRFHPLLELLNPLPDKLKRSLPPLKRSLRTIGQIRPIIVTVDDFILDGRRRFLIAQDDQLNPPIYKLDNIWSCVDPLPNGFDLEHELDTLKHVLQVLHSRSGANSKKPIPQFVASDWRPN